MKILIISPPRCGSTALLKHISDGTNSKRISEPFNYDLHKNIEYTYPMVLDQHYVIKYITTQTPKEHGTPDDFVDFITSDVLNYDKVILLSRRNKIEHMESLINLHMRMSSGKNVLAQWHGDDIKHIPFNYDIGYLLNKYVNMINKISLNLDIPITYYEDLYGEDRIKSHDIIKNWNLDIDVNLLNEKTNPQYRNRQFKERTLI